jgi:hypothetical protein
LFGVCLGSRPVGCCGCSTRFGFGERLCDLPCLCLCLCPSVCLRLRDPLRRLPRLGHFAGSVLHIRAFASSRLGCAVRLGPRKGLLLQL